MGEAYSLGLDIGGTFTDFVLLHDDTGDVLVHKHLTSYPDVTDGVLAGLEELLQERGVGPEQIHTIVHSTTLVTNAIIERKGALAGLLATEGFPHILDLGKEQRYDAYDIFLNYPEPLIPPDLRHEVRERMTRDGAAVITPSRDQVLAGVADLVDRGVESLAVCFLHAYRNPSHERYVANMIRTEYPEVFLSLSSMVSPNIGEWETTSTTAADAYVRPIVHRYLSSLERELGERGFSGKIYITLSNGGTGSLSMAQEYPIRLLESGPAAGVIAGSYYGRLTDNPDLLVFDMGGTTAKICLIEGYAPYVTDALEVDRAHRFKRGSGLPVRVPSVELLEAGAGGGSIAWRDELGLLKVGPQSAGADPGPACYGTGGDDPTVTDASLVLGYYDSDYFVGGRMQLYPERSEAVIRSLGEELRLEVAATAWGIHQVVNENMASAARIHVIERGRDPRYFSLVAFGGCGPAHATAVARILGSRRVVIPLAAGTTSALGSLAAPFSFHVSRTQAVRLSLIDWDDISAMITTMEMQARDLLLDAGAAPEQVQIERFADMRMYGQLHEVRVPLPVGQFNAAAIVAIRESFYRTYRSRYSYANEDIELEFVDWHVTATAHVLSVELTAHPDGSGTQLGEALKGRRPAYFAQAGDYIDCPVYDRYRLRPGMSLGGPAIIEERESTVVLQPGDYATVDEYLNLIIEVGT